MTAPTKQEMLDNVEIAINRLAAGGAVQSYSINGRSLQRYSLIELMRLRDQLKKEISACNSATTRAYGTFERP
jgi:hypothetical protein